jgi:hypothetical protein
MSKKEKYTYDEIFLIYYDDGCGDTDLIAVTNDLEKWIDHHNLEREADDMEPEGLEDFDIVEEGLINFKTKKR